MFLPSKICPTTSELYSCACKQQPDETFEKYLNRLTNIFNEFAGLTQPAQLGDVASTWEQSLIGAFRQGMLPHLAKAVRKSTDKDKQQRRNPEQLREGGGKDDATSIQ